MVLSGSVREVNGTAVTLIELPAAAHRTSFHATVGKSSTEVMVKVDTFEPAAGFTPPWASVTFHENDAVVLFCIWSAASSTPESTNFTLPSVMSCCVKVPL